MAYNLNELAKVAKTPYDKAVLRDLLRQSKVLQTIPVVNTNALKVAATRWQTLPSTGTRKVNGSYTESTGVTENIESTLHIYGGDITIDRVLTKVQAQEAPLTTQTAMKVASMTATFNNDFINGDHATNPDGYEGLKKLVSNQPARMTVDLASGGDALKVLASAANEHLLIDAMHEAMHKVDGGNAGNVVCFMNEATYLGVGKTLRRVGLLSTQKDQYERVWETFAGAKLIDVGLLGDQSTEIILSTEDPGDGGNDSTSIYFARLGSDDGLHLLQLSGTSPTPYDPLQGAEGGLGAVPGLVRRIDWVIGLRAKGRYAVARVKGFKMAAS